MPLEVKTWPLAPLAINAVCPLAIWYGICDAIPPAKLVAVVAVPFNAPLKPVELNIPVLGLKLSAEEVILRAVTCPDVTDVNVG